MGGEGSSESPIAGIDDDELILFYFRDGLSAERLEQIERALARSAVLRQRYEKLCAVLVAVNNQAVPEPVAGFEERLWKRLQARMRVKTS
jgi:hypothetical protein